MGTRLASGWLHAMATLISARELGYTSISVSPRHAIPSDKRNMTLRSRPSTVQKYSTFVASSHSPFAVGHSKPPVGKLPRSLPCARTP